jgi:5'-nucleotidase
MEEFRSQSRRGFLKKTLLGTGALAAFATLPDSVWAAVNEDHIKLTILHTNDQHSQIDPFPSSDIFYPNQGGFARRASLIRKIRSEETNVLLLDAGDIWQGTPYFNIFGGELEFKLMSEMKYDAATIGEHELDNGLDGLVKQLPNATFPFINCNYDLSDTPINGKAIPYKIFEKEGLKIGVFGLGIELKGLIDKKKYGNTVYLDPVQKAAEYSHLLKKEMKCELVICLSHLGDKYNDNKISDTVIAKQSKNIDLFIGGHTHRFLEKPAELRNSDGNQVLVAQAGFAGLRLGRVDCYFHRGKKKNATSGTTLVISPD